MNVDIYDRACAPQNKYTFYRIKRQNIGHSQRFKERIEFLTLHGPHINKKAQSRSLEKQYSTLEKLFYHITQKSMRRKGRDYMLTNQILYFILYVML